MTVPAHSTVRKSDELPKEIIDLVSVIGELPVEHRDRVEQVLARVVDSTRRRRRILQLVQDALSQLRLDMKYLMFDLEATRRERDEYRRQLEGE
ncbi:MAG TPA: transcriptional regulator [Planctomycetaceae bacterium]|nr:transcriptional regulator [Planctomycetaceae bacterium]